MANCASQLTEASPGFATASQEVDAACQRVVGWSFCVIQNDDPRWNDPAWAKTATLAVQLALSAWWRSVGITPDVVIGQGVGELAAACVAGILTIDEALLLVAPAQTGNGHSNGTIRPRPAQLPFLSTSRGQSQPVSTFDVAAWQSMTDVQHGVTGAVAAMADRQVDFCLTIGTACEHDPLIHQLAQGRGAEFVIPSIVADMGRVNVLSAVGRLVRRGPTCNGDR